MPAEPALEPYELPVLVTSSPVRSNRQGNKQEADQGLERILALEEGLRDLAVDITVGVDRVSLRYPLAESAYGPELAPFKGRGRRWVEDQPHSPHIRVYGLDYTDGLVQQSCPTVTVDFNPSRSKPHEGLCPLAWTEPVVRRGFDALQERLPCAVPASEVALTRIDLARDFTVPLTGRWLAASVGNRAARARKQAGYFGRDGRLQTVVSETASTRVVLYDKYEQSPSEHTSRYRLRWEAQITGSQPASKLGVGSLDRLGTQRLCRAMASMWIKGKMGETVCRPQVGEVVRDSHLRPHDKRAVLAWLHDEQEHLGLHDDLPRRDVQHLRQLARDIGVHLKHNGRVEVRTGLERLDLLLGRPVLVS